MKLAVSHNRAQESIEAKTAWFKSLSMSERMDIFCSITDLALSTNPRLKDRKNAKPITGRIQVLSAARS